MSSTRSPKDTPHRFSKFIVGKRLHLSDKNIGDSDIPEIIAFLNQQPHIKEVDLSHNRIGAQGAKDFAMHNKIATQVNLAYNHIGDEGAKDFAEHNKIATQVNLSVNRIGAQGAKDFAMQNKIATQVDLSHNKIDDAGVKFFMHNKTITQLNLSDNNISSHMMKAVNQQIAANRLYCQTWMKTALMMTSVKVLNNNNSRKDCIYGVLELIPEILEFAGVEKENAVIKKGNIKKGRIHDGFVNTLFFKREVFNQLPTGANKKGLRRIRDGFVNTAFFKHEEFEQLPPDANADQPQESSPTLCSLL